MSFIKKFSVSNFRVFKDLTDFEFAPITILTGTNSSGKSSLISAIKVVSQYANRCLQNDNFVNDLFKNENQNPFGKAENILNNKGKINSNEIGFKISCEKCILGIDFTIINSNIKFNGITLWDSDNNKILSFKLKYDYTFLGYSILS